jgi:hypothetical protein
MLSFAFFIVMLSVIMLSVVILNVVVLSVVVLSVLMLDVVILIVIRPKRHSCANVVDAAYYNSACDADYH